MTIADVLRNLDLPIVGQEMFGLIADLYPICRSITGDGVRETLRRVQTIAPLTIHEVPSGTQVFDWTVPNEWNVRDAYVADATGKRIIDFRRSNLHVVNYSVPTRKRVTLEELRDHLFTLPDRPEWIPYRTSYYKETWGFCLTHSQYARLEPGDYDVCIDATLEPGHLTYGEYYLPGAVTDEILLSCHVCHPSLCNDNLSGVAVVAHLAKHLANVSRRYSYRFLFIPGTIGAITWLCRNEAITSRIAHGLVAACLGDAGRFTYKRSRRGHAEIDRAVLHALTHSGSTFDVVDFSPYGYDERQFCSPGFDLPVGSLTRTPHGCFPEYHTSADNLDLVSPRQLAGALSTYLRVLEILEGNRRYKNLNPKCEPQLGRRGLYSLLGGRAKSPNAEVALLWVLNLSDGHHSLLDICERSRLPFPDVARATDALVQATLLEAVVA